VARMMVMTGMWSQQTSFQGQQASFHM
jgi:hypothetical protein